MFYQSNGQATVFSSDYIQMLLPVNGYAPLTSYHIWSVQLGELLATPNEQEVIKAVQAFEQYGQENYGPESNVWSDLNIWARSILGMTMLVVEAAYTNLPQYNSESQKHLAIGASLHQLRRNLNLTENPGRYCIGQLLEELFQEAQSTGVGRSAFCCIAKAVSRYDPEFSEEETGQVVRTFMGALRQGKMPIDLPQSHPMLTWLEKQLAQDQRLINTEPKLPLSTWQRLKVLLGGTPTRLSLRRIAMYCMATIMLITSGVCLWRSYEDGQVTSNFEDIFINSVEKGVLIRGQ